MSWWVWAIIILVVLGMIGNSKEKGRKGGRLTALRIGSQKCRREVEQYILASGDKQAILQLRFA
jgi:hypothetical protein